MAGEHLHIFEAVVNASAIDGVVTLGAGAEIYMFGNIPVVAHRLDATANIGIRLQTDVDEIVAHNNGTGFNMPHSLGPYSGSGEILIEEVDGVTLENVTNADGPIHVIAGGRLTALGVRSLNDALGHNVGLMTNSGDILVDYVEAGSSFGQVTLSAYGDIREGPTTDSALDVSADFVLVYAKDNVANGQARLETSQNDKYEFEDQDILIFNIKRDVEVFLKTAHKIVIKVKRAHDNVVVVAETDNEDVILRTVKKSSDRGDIYVGSIQTGPNDGKVDLDSKGDIRLVDRLYNGEEGRITSGSDTVLEADRGIHLEGVIDAANDLKFKTRNRDGLITLSGANLNSGDDIGVRSHAAMVVDQTVFDAGDNILLKTMQSNGGTLALTNSDLTAGNDITVKAKATLTLINSNLNSGDDIGVTSHAAMVVDQAVFDAGDNILLKTMQSNAGTLALTNSDLTAGNDITVKAKATLTLINSNLNSGDDIGVTSHAAMVVDQAVFDAGDNILLKTMQSNGGTLALTNSDLTAGNDITVKAKATLTLINSNLNSGDDIGVTSHAAMVVDQAVFDAGDNILLKTMQSNAGTLALTNSDLTAGNDITVKAKATLTLINSNLNSGDDIGVTSHGRHGRRSGGV